MRKTALFASLIATAMTSLFSSCLDSDKDLYDNSFQTPNPMGEGFVAPDGFGWNMLNNIQVIVDVNDQFKGAFNYKVEIYDENPIISENANLICSGVAKEGEPFKSEISIDKVTKTIYVKEYTPTGLYTVRAAEIPADGVVNCNFKTVASSTRSLAMTRGFVTIQDPNHTDESLFPKQCPANVTEVFVSESSSIEGHSYKVTSTIKKIDLGQKKNIKLYVTGNIKLNEELYLTAGSCLYILPGYSVTMPISKKNSQTNSLISIGTGSNLTVDADIQIGNNFRLYNLGTIEAENLACTSSSVFYNAGTVTLGKKLSGENSGSTIVNAGAIKAEQVYIQGDSHLINRDLGVVEVDDETVLNCGGGSWENDGKWTTEEMKISAWNDFSINRCQLIVKDELNISEGHLIIDGGGYAQCNKLYMNNSRVDLGAKSLFEITDEAEFGYQSKDRGFKGTGTTKGLLVMQKVKASYPENADIIHYSGNLQILCSDHPKADLGWGKRWTLTNGAEWTAKGGNTLVIPKTSCNAGYGEETTNKPSEPIFPIIMEDNNEYAYAFEDQWPLYGDYDLNDIVMIIQNRKIFTDNKNKVKRFELSIDLSAVGATKQLGAAIMFDGIPASAITTALNLDNNSLIKSFKLTSQNIEEGQDLAVVPLFENAHYALLERNANIPINTISDNSSNTKQAKSINFSIEFNNPTLSADAFNINKLNIFIIVGGNKEKRREIHVAGFQPSKLAETDIFGGNNDNSSLSNKRYYVSKENLAWGIMVPASFKWPLEYTNIKTAYSKFEDWVKSGGTKEEHWWNDFAVNKVFQTNQNQN